MYEIMSVLIRLYYIQHLECKAAICSSIMYHQGKTVKLYLR